MPSKVTTNGKEDDMTPKSDAKIVIGDQGAAANAE